MVLEKVHFDFRATAKLSIIEATQKVNSLIQEADNLYIKVRWDTVADPIINTLGKRNPAFAVRLQELKNNGAELPYDASPEIGKLMAIIVAETREIERND